MQHWHLPDVEGSTDKLHAREPGADAPRVSSHGREKPQVLFSHPECRGILLSLAAGERMDDHVVRERAIVEVVSGHVTVECAGNETDCRPGALVCFDPDERHALVAHEESRLLLLLTPWRATQHANDPERLPRNATATEEP